MAKDFKAPIADFFNDEARPAERIRQTATPDNTEIRYKVPVEVKSKRLNLVMQPTAYTMAKDRAAELNISINEYIHRLIKTDWRTREAR